MWAITPGHFQLLLRNITQPEGDNVDRISYHLVSRFLYYSSLEMGDTAWEYVVASVSEKTVFNALNRILPTKSRIVLFTQSTIIFQRELEAILFNLVITESVDIKTIRVSDLTNYQFFSKSNKIFNFYSNSFKMTIKSSNSFLKYKFFTILTNLFEQSFKNRYCLQQYLN